MNRRKFLTAAQATAFAAAVAAAYPNGAVAGETTILQLFREWKERRDWLDGPEAETLSEAEFNLVCGKNDRLGDLIVAMRCETASDFAAKVVVATMDGLNDFKDTTVGMKVLAEARALIG